MPMSLVAHIAAFTHRGRVRAHNEDTIVVGDWVSPLEMEEPRSFRHRLPASLVCAVADGLGGHSAGEVASRHAAERLSAEAARLTTSQAIGTMLSRINAELYDAMTRDPSCAGMGTTVAGLVLGERP